MIIEKPLETGKARRIVWCLDTDIIDNNDGTYSFANIQSSSVGFGTKVNVINANMVLFFDNENNVLYPWLIKEEEE